MVPLKYLSKFSRTVKMPLINCEISFILTWSKIYIVASETVRNQETTFAVTHAKLYVPVVTLPTQDNAKILQQLKSGFKRTINWNKCQWKLTIRAPNPYLYFLIDPRNK